MGFRGPQATKGHMASDAKHGLRHSNQHGLRPLKQHGLRPLNQHGLRPLKQHGLRPLKQHGLRPLKQHGLRQHGLRQHGLKALKSNMASGTHTNIDRLLKVSNMTQTKLGVYVWSGELLHQGWGRFLEW